MMNTPFLFSSSTILSLLVFVSRHHDAFLPQTLIALIILYRADTITSFPSAAAGAKNIIGGLLNSLLLLFF